MTEYADVLLSLPLDRPFTYGVPENLRELVKVGSRVTVPFRNRRTSGFVVGLPTKRPSFAVKPVEAVVGDAPFIGPRELELAKWMAERWMCGWGEALEAMVPAGVKKEMAARTVTRVKLKTAPEVIKSQAQRRVIDALQAAGGELTQADLMARAKVSAAPLKTLQRAGAIELFEVEGDPEAFSGLVDHTPKDLALTPEQGEALAIIRASRKAAPHGVLLHGVTGSGKTEVYLRSIREEVDAGRQAIVLVPEIALTPQAVSRFRSRFPRTVVLHSVLTEGERADQWRACRAGGVDVVVGARSAIFAPLPALGLVVVDEEHEPSYKQESDPRYHVRDVALHRAKVEGAGVILGSATPSLESISRARKGELRIARLPERIGGRGMPRIDIVDMGAEARETKRVPIISRALAQAVTAAHKRGEQSILFLNRRGYVTYVSCKRCEWTFRCRHCDVGMTWHKDRNRAECHQCFAAQPMPTTCPACSAAALNLMSLGTERIEEEVREKFPGLRVARMDSDAMRSKRDYRDALKSLAEGKTDVMVGTQMIAKGLDFANVTVVGVITADTAFHHPDFRAAERTFQLLTQVAGRAGRGPKGGRVIVQTWNPAHHAITCAAAYEGEKFVEREMDQRRELGFPPFGDLVRIVVSGTREPVVKAAAAKLGESLRKEIPSSAAEILGPSPAPIARLKSRWRHHLLIKTKSLDAIRAGLKKAVAPAAHGSSIRVEVDVDPVYMS